MMPNAHFAVKTLFIMALILLPLLFNQVHARSAATPWTSEMSVQNLVYGASSTADVQQIIGLPDEILREEQMYPVVENFYYYGDGGTGEATVFVFENNLLVGMFYRSPVGQFVDLTSFLPNNGDRILNLPSLAGFRGYYPNYPTHYSW